MYFLNDRRRLRLIADLVKLTMPTNLAEQWANIPEHQIDARLDAVIENHSERFHALATADKNGVRCLRAFLEADALIICTYMAELREKGLTLQ